MKKVVQGKLIFTGAVFFAGIFLLSAESFAKNCNSYARSAVSSQATNKAKKCGFSGFGWHSDFQIHLGWCLIAPASQVNSATAQGAANYRLVRIKLMQAVIKAGVRSGRHQPIVTVMLARP